MIENMVIKKTQISRNCGGSGFAYYDVSWQRFITRLAAHGHVTPLVPASILQIINSELIISGIVAEDCKTEIGERKISIKL
jgi:hypothetical protein